MSRSPQPSTPTGNLLPQGNDLIDAGLDAGLGGEKITISD
jgi:hypothetical protein